MSKKNSNVKLKEGFKDLRDLEDIYQNLIVTFIYDLQINTNINNRIFIPFLIINTSIFIIRYFLPFCKFVQLLVPNQ